MTKVISVKVMPRSSINKVKKFERFYKVWLTAVPEKGKANEKLIETLAKYLKIKKSAITIIQGTKMRKKLVEIEL